MLRTLSAAVLSLGLLSASACGGDGTTITTPDGTVKVDADGSDFSVEGEDGTKVEGGTELPEGFPDEVPLVDGRIIQAVKATDGASGGGFSVSIEVDGDVTAAFADASGRLEAADFADEGYLGTSGEVSLGTYTSPEWQVLVSVSPSGDGGKVFVNYTIARAS